MRRSDGFLCPLKKRNVWFPIMDIEERVIYFFRISCLFLEKLIEKFFMPKTCYFERLTLQIQRSWVIHKHSPWSTKFEDLLAQERQHVIQISPQHFIPFFLGWECLLPLYHMVNGYEIFNSFQLLLLSWNFSQLKIWGFPQKKQCLLN